MDLVDMMKRMITLLALVFSSWGASAQAAAPAHETSSAGPGSPSDLFRKGDFGPLDKHYAGWLAKGREDRNPSGLSNATVFLGEVMPPVVRAPSPNQPQGRVSGGTTPPPELPPYGNEGFWEPVQAQARKWLAASPNSTLAVNLLADAHIRQAWTYRGETAAVHVSPRAFEKFSESLGAALQVLSRNEHIGKSDPNWWVRMIEVTHLLGVERQRWNQIVDAAVLAFPWHQGIYFKAAMGKLPQWGGSLEEFAELADRAVRNTQDKEGQSMYARVYWAHSHAIDPAAIASGQVDWQRIRAGFEDVVARYPHKWNLNHFARMACFARDKATVQRLMVTVGSQVEPAAWRSREHFMRCKEFPND